MVRILLGALVLLVWLAPAATAQPTFRAPDVRSMKSLTTRYSDHASDIPGKETLMEYFMGANGQVVTIYTFNGRRVAFSTHKNNDIQNTYRIFIDLNGNGLFTEVNRAMNWQVPHWAR